METKKIRFVANRAWLDAGSASQPVPMAKTIPEWYRKAERFVPDPATGKPWEPADGSGKVPTWRACPAVYDVMGSGYAYRTPCDIEFAEDAAGEIHARVLDERYSDFLQVRHPMPQFVNPPGYHHKHFAWWADWAVELPPGYSALYTHPLNRFELPFLTTSGIVDNDKVHLPGTMPFFVLRGVSGILPAGTPYAQILPFLREHWAADIEAPVTEAELKQKNQANSRRYRQPDGGVYLQQVWERRKYS